MATTFRWKKIFTFENSSPSQIVIMSSIMIDEEEESTIPDSSVSQRVEQSSVTGLSESKPESDSIGDYFIVKDTPECLEEVKRLLSKGPDSVCQLWDLFNFTECSNNLVLEQKGLERRTVARVLRMCSQKEGDGSRCLQILSSSLYPSEQDWKET